MAKYVALIRGIGPGDPRKTNKSLCSTLEKLGFSNVQSVITSGNVIFESNETDVAKLEEKIEAGWRNILGFEATTIVRNLAQLQAVLDHGFFDGFTHSQSSYLLVTFFRSLTVPKFDIPHQPESKPYTIVGYADNVLYTVTDNTVMKTTDLMTWLEKQFTKNITSRTPLTIERIIRRVEGK